MKQKMLHARHMKSDDEQGYLGILLVVVVAALMALGSAVYFERLARQAEQTEFRQVLNQVRRALAAEVYTRIIRNQGDTLQELADKNPFDLFGVPPSDYAGVISNYADKPEPGSWYYDAHLNDLAYRVRATSVFSTQGPFPDEARFHLSMSFTDVNRNGVFDRGIDRFLMMDLKPRYPYEWRND